MTRRPYRPARERGSRPPVLNPEASRRAWRTLCERAIALEGLFDSEAEADPVMLARELAAALDATPVEPPLDRADVRGLFFRRFRDAVADWRGCASPAVRTTFARGLAAQALDVREVLIDVGAAVAVAANARTNPWDRD